MIYEINFSIDGMKEKILNGEKTQTIRALKRFFERPKKGDVLILIWKNKEKLKEVECSDVKIKYWRDIKNDENLAKKDGFNSLEEFNRTFKDMYPSLNDKKLFMIIEWKDMVKK